MRLVPIICALVLALAGAVLGAARPPAVTGYARMTQDLEADAARCPLIRVVSLGQSSRDRKDLWLARIADPAVPAEETVRILILCRQHGDEPASTEAALQLLHGLAAGHDPGLQNDLKRVTLYLLPMVNPDGADVMTRRNGGEADLNRDWGVFSQPETRAVVRAARLIRPQIVIDAHNWDGDDPYNANCVEVVRADATPLERATHGVQQVAAGALTGIGFSVNLTTYGVGADAHLAHRYFTQQGALSMLVETHSGDPNDQADFQRRRAFYLTLIHGLSHHYGQGTAADRLVLEHAEPAWILTTQEAELFAPTATSRAAGPRSAPTRRFPRWLWTLCVYGLAMWIGGVCRCRPTAHPDGGNGKPRRAEFAPAIERLSAVRPGTPRYRYSPCSPGFRPSPVACGRKQ